MQCNPLRYTLCADNVTRYLRYNSLSYTRVLNTALGFAQMSRLYHHLYSDVSSTDTRKENTIWPRLWLPGGYSR